ncbi:MAG: Ig-like domain-containing protein [Plesiomonas sp.]|uniref:Ig-like domain-containing protein n=1 Tax=Plesiomonas sp. TaxID=2486279 RepID=UPI003F3638E2
MILTACDGGGGGGTQWGGNSPEPNIVSLQVTPAMAAIPVGFDQELVAIATLSDGTTKDVTNDTSLTWISSDSSIATIVSSQLSGNGVATGVKPGSVTITVAGTSNSTPFSATAQLEVTEVVVTNLQVTSAAASIAVGLAQQFTAIAIFSDDSMLDVTHQAALSWASSDPTVATIDSNGLATGVKPGLVSITASGIANGTPFSATAQLEVTNVIVTELRVTPEKASIAAGLSQQFTASATLSDGSMLDVTHQAALSWASSDVTTATIDRNGLATGVKLGTVTITASGIANGTPFSATAQFDVTDAIVTELRVTPEEASIPVGLSQQFTASAILSDGSILDVTNEAVLSWTSSDAPSATIARNGLATGVNQGTVTITASGIANGKSFTDTAQLNVTDAIATDLRLMPDDSSVPVGLKKHYIAILSMSDGSTLDVTNSNQISWTSSNSSIASNTTTDNPRDSRFEGVAKGTVTITASVALGGDRFTERANLVVEDKPLLPFFEQPPIVPFSYDKAVEYCEQLTPASRLPNVSELNALFDRYSTKANDMCTDHNWPLNGLCNGQTGLYWTLNPANVVSKFVVNMSHNSLSSLHDKDGEANVTCVRR